MKIDLKDVTFCIPIFIDSPERLENVKCTLKFLHNNFDAKFSVCEYVNIGRNFNWDIGQILTAPCLTHVFDEDVAFSRTEAINKAITHPGVKTPYIAIYDVDVIFDAENILKAVKLLRAGFTLTYPYSGKFIDIERSYIKDGIIKPVSDSYVLKSYGGACFLNREDYFKCGLENEHLIGGHVPDDVERLSRIQKLGFPIERVEGNCYHINHPPGPDMGNRNKLKDKNEAEYKKVNNMTKNELITYIETWPWKTLK
ncbi:MAG TPA: hypothetical protein PK289_04425 [Bacteroidia bacterium]|nr:hypothetical protein [Bacteroidia bacterium]